MREKNNLYRCTRDAMYSDPNCAGYIAVALRDGYYIKATYFEEAICEMKRKFPNESFSIHLFDASEGVWLERVGTCNKEKIESKWAAFNKSCEYHGQNVEIEVLDTWVYPKSKIIELRCIDICKQCGEGYGKIYTLFADKFVKEV